MKISWGKLFNLIVILILLQSSGLNASAQTPAGRPDPRVPQSTAPSTDGPISENIVLKPPSARQPGAEKISPDLMKAAETALVNVSVRGSMASLAQTAKSLSPAERIEYAAKVNAFQNTLEQGIVANGGTVIYRMRTLGSGVIASIPANMAKTLSSIPGVAYVSRLYDFQTNLDETVSFIGGDALKSFGIKGKGVKVAIMDSGIDFTHLAFGGSPDPAVWEQAYYGSDPACTTGAEPQCANRKAVDPAFANLFGPTGLRVKGGFDWVGPNWTSTSGALLPDPNPIALASTGTHGTHVADIIGGLGYPAGSYGPQGNTTAYPAKGEGVAPEADLYAFTVCSAITSSCSGVAMLQGMDDAADLDDNPGTIDPADVMNMSLGSDYGQPEDDATWLSNELTQYGTIVVLSAGNGSNMPYKVGSPSIASGAISVAQTAVPSAKQYRVIVNTPGAIAGDLDNPYLHDWSAAYYTATITGDVVFDNTNASTRIGCTDGNGTKPPEWTAGRFTGKIVLINRGLCGASFKVANAYDAGASMVLVSMVAAGAPYPFAYAGGTFTIPSFSITLADGNKLKSGSATQPLPASVVTLATVTANPAVYVSLANTIVSTSSRGPRNHDNKIKPDVGAPGASVSAVAGTGSEIAPFGGTSGAAPMVTGSMALLKSLFKDEQNFANPQLSPAQYKALLMNSANNQIFEGRSVTNPTGSLVPVARIGAGQVDLTKALKTKILAYDVTDEDQLEWTGSLSYQYAAVTTPTTITRKLRILNLNPFEKTIHIGWDYRYASEDNGAVTLEPAKNSVTLAPGAFEDVNIVMHINPAKLAPWFDWNNWFVVDRGYLGGNGDNFKQVEYSGYLYLGEQLATSIIKETTVPWLVIPKPVADVSADVTPEIAEGTIDLTNSAGATSHTDLFNLVDINPNDYNFTVGNCASIGLGDGCNQSPLDLKEVGYRMWQSATTSYIDFGITLWDAPYRAGIWPPEFDIYVDTVHPLGTDPQTYGPGPDGVPDYVIYNTENGGFAASGQEVAIVVNLHTNAASIVTYLDSTFNSNNYILTVPAASIGLNIPITGALAPDALIASKMNFEVLVFEAYMTGNLTDTSPSIPASATSFNIFDQYHKVDVLADRWHIDMNDQVQTINVGQTVNIPYTLMAPADWVASGSQIGFLAMYREAPIQMESDAVQLGPVVKSVLFVPYFTNPGSEPGR